MLHDGPRAVLLIGNFPPPYGGIPTHLAYLAPYLAARGWDVHILSLKNSAETERDHGGFRVYRPPKLGRPAKLGLLLRGAMKVLAHFSTFRADRTQFIRYLQLHEMAEGIVHKRGIRAIGAYHVFPSGLVGLWLKRKYGLPMVTTIFGEFFMDPDFHRRRLRETAMVLDASDTLLSCSRHCAGSPAILGLPHRAGTLYYGIDVARFVPRSDAAAVRARFQVPPTGALVMYLARMELEMGLGVMMDAIPALLAADPGLRFMLAGRSGPLREKAEALQRSLPANVFTAADVPVEDLPDLYAAASLVVIPSINERACLGLAIAEAMACRKPVVVSRMGGGPEVAFDGEHGLLVPPGDARALAQAVLSLIADPARMEAMGMAGRARIEDVFDKEKTNAAMEAYLSGNPARET
jgi:glycosyltransferase involved in cell wall biosynthesis